MKQTDMAAQADSTPLPGRQPTLDVLARLHEDACAFYTARLFSERPDADRVLALLERRAVAPRTVAGFELGYAPPGWTALVDQLHAAGYTAAELLDAGLALTTRQGTLVDRFRDRLMFPVRDPSGQRVIAFIGRALHPAEQTPKYLNSPETALYRKSDVLYGLGAASVRRALAAGAHPVLVEGTLDAIAVTNAAAGSYAGIAPSGTALTARQVAALNRHAGPLPATGVIVAFDGDTAGQQAAIRSFDLLRAAGAWPTAATHPAGQDPASLAEHGPGRLLAALNDAAHTPLADRVVDARLDRWQHRLHQAEGKVGAARDAARLIATFPPDQIAPQVLRVADRTGLNPGTITTTVTDAITTREKVIGPARTGQPDTLESRPAPPGPGSSRGTDTPRSPRPADGAARNASRPRHDRRLAAPSRHQCAVTPPLAAPRPATPPPAHNEHRPKPRIPPDPPNLPRSGATRQADRPTFLDAQARPSPSSADASPDADDPPLARVR